MKTALKAGIALAALSAAVAIAGSASAADLGGSMKDGYVQPMPEVMRGPSGPCYFRADVGYSVSSDPDVKWPVNSDVTTNEFTGPDIDHAYLVSSITNSVFVTNDVTNVKLENSWFGEVGMGCGSGPRGLRGELMLGMHGSKKLDGEPGFYARDEINNFTPDLPAAPGPDVVPPDEHTDFQEDPLHTNIKSYTAMFNAYKDLGQFGNITPYVGAGLGVAYHIVDETYFTGNPNLVNRIEGNRDISFAWARVSATRSRIAPRSMSAIATSTSVRSKRAGSTRPGSSTPQSRSMISRRMKSRSACATASVVRIAARLSTFP
jgi:opacity protein-like surface antigen